MGEIWLEHLKQYSVHFLLLRLRLSALQSLALSGCLGYTSATTTPPNEFGAGTSGLVLAPATTLECTQFYLRCSDCERVSIRHGHNTRQGAELGKHDALTQTSLASD